MRSCTLQCEKNGVHRRSHTLQCEKNGVHRRSRACTFICTIMFHRLLLRVVNVGISWSAGKKKTSLQSEGNRWEGKRSRTEETMEQWTKAGFLQTLFWCPRVSRVLRPFHRLQKGAGMSATQGIFARGARCSLSPEFQCGEQPPTSPFTSNELSEVFNKGYQSQKSKSLSLNICKGNRFASCKLL